MRSEILYDSYLFSSVHRIYFEKSIRAYSWLKRIISDAFLSFFTSLAKKGIDLLQDCQFSIRIDELM